MPREQKAPWLWALSTPPYLPRSSKYKVTDQVPQGGWASGSWFLGVAAVPIWGENHVSSCWLTCPGWPLPNRRSAVTAPGYQDQLCHGSRSVSEMVTSCGISCACPHHPGAPALLPHPSVVPHGSHSGLESLHVAPAPEHCSGEDAVRAYLAAIPPAVTRVPLPVSSQGRISSSQRGWDSGLLKRARRGLRRPRSRHGGACFKSGRGV